MKQNQQVKKIKNRPMRSPSPDLTSRNAIQNTVVNTGELQQHMECKYGRHSVSPRITNNSMSFQVYEQPNPEVDHLKQKIK